jgi:hypothetical protein
MQNRSAVLSVAEGSTQIQKQGKSEKFKGKRAS